MCVCVRVRGVGAGSLFGLLCWCFRGRFAFTVFGTNNTFDAATADDPYGGAGDWVGASLGVCGTSTVFGGYYDFGQNMVMSRSAINLPPHGYLKFEGV